MEESVVKIRLVGGFLLCMLSLAHAESERKVYLSDISSQSNGWQFFTEDGSKVTHSQVKNERDWEMRTTRLSGVNVALTALFSPYSWIIAATNVNTSIVGPWCDGSGVMTIGGGGVTMAANNMIKFGNSSRSVRVRLGESQTWRGPAEGTAYAYFALGCDNTWKENIYSRACIAATNDLIWTLDGRITVSMTASNDLSNVDVIVNKGARIALVKQDDGTWYDPHLGARSLTLNGFDEATGVAPLTIGGKNPHVGFLSSPGAPSVFDDVTLAPKVILLDGATVGGKKFDYALSELCVSNGTSVISADVTFTRPVHIDIGPDARLEFSGTLTAAGGGITVTGDGELAFMGPLVSVPVAGSGRIVCGVEGKEIVLSGDLSRFTGTIHAEAGSVLIHPDARLNEAARLTAADGASVRVLTAEDFGDFVEQGRGYYRGLNGVLHPYLYPREYPKGSNYYWPRPETFYAYPDSTEGGNVPWKDGSVVCFSRRWDGGLGSSYDMDICGIIRTPESGSTTHYIDADKNITVGERGIEFLGSSMGIYVYKRNNYFRLSESQTWKGTAADALDNRHNRIYMGGNWYSLYPTGSMTPLKDDLTLTLEGNLILSIYYPSNDFSRANLVVKAPALVMRACPGGNDTYKSYYGRLNAKTLVLDGGPGLYIGSKTIADTSVGSPAEVSPIAVARRIVVKNGACLTATKEATWTETVLAAAAGSEGGLSGTFVLKDETLFVEAEEGAVLDLTGATFRPALRVTAGISAKGPGTVRVSFDNLSLLDGGFAVDGASVEVVGSGYWTNSLAKANGFSVSSEGGPVSVSAAALAGYRGEELRVTKGTLVLDSVASLPQGCKVVTAADGKLVLLDATGFDADVHMGGTKNCGTDPYIVTEAPRENETIALDDGAQLHVFGSGLKASSSITMGRNAAVRFYRPATVYSPINVTGAVTFATLDVSGESRIAGKVTGNGNVSVSAPGGLVFSGGADFKWSFTQKDGRVTLFGKSIYFYSFVNILEGHLLMTNCYVRSFNNTWSMNSSSQTGDVLCEIAAGATWSLDNNSVPYIGGHKDFESRILISGGTMSHLTYDTIQMNSGGTGKAVFEFASGVLNSERRIIVGRNAEQTDGYAKFIWRGGTWKTHGNPGYRYKYRYLFQGKNATGNGGLEFSIEGPDCVLDLGMFEYPDCISNFCNLASSKMTGKPGARLKIKGKQGVVSNFVLLDFDPNGMELDLNSMPRSNVEVVGNGSPVHLTWVTPGTNGMVMCSGTPSPLLASYVVTEGGTFENAFTQGWNSGFLSQTDTNLTFSADAAYLLRPTAAGLTPLSLAGSLILPEAMTYVVDRSAGRAPVGKDIVLVETGAGIVGECEWTANGGISCRDSSVTAEEGRLLLDYVPSGTTVIIR